MSIFSAILDKLGLGNKPKPAASSTPKPPKPAEPAASTAATHPTHKPAISTPAPSAPRPMVSQKPAAPTHKPSVTLPTAQMPVATASSPEPEPEVEPMSKVDVMAKLEGMAAKLGTPSNWKTSIADLLFLLGMDHSYAARKELAVELGCPPEYLDDSVKMNTWLHKTVLAQIAENGGNIPAELLD